MVKRKPPTGTALDLRDEFRIILKARKNLQFNSDEDFPPGFKIAPYSVVVIYGVGVGFPDHLREAFEKIASFRKGVRTDLKEGGNIFYITFSTGDYGERAMFILRSQWLKLFKKIQADPIVFERKILRSDDAFTALLEHHKII